MDTGVVEIDPEFFITCRLCVGEKGLYQITPILQHQIKFCYDITIETFDGWSQIICRGCKSVLEQYYLLKTTLQENQTKFLKKINSIDSVNEPNDLCQQQDQEVVSSSQDFKSTTDTLCDESVKSPKTTKCSSETDPASDHDVGDEKRETDPHVGDEKRETDPHVGDEKRETDPHVGDEKRETDPHAGDEKLRGEHTLPRKRRKSTPDISWKFCFQEYYVCRYCDRHCKSRKLVLLHLHSHQQILNKTHEALSKHCKVSLNRINDLPNLTGNINKSNGIVVLDSNTLILDRGHIDYYVTYLPRINLPRKSSSISEDNFARTKKRGVIWECTEILSSGDSDGSAGSKKPRLRKKIRLISSSSSSDAAVIENDDVIKANTSINNVQQKESQNKSELTPNDVTITDSEHLSVNAFENKQPLMNTHKSHTLYVTVNVISITIEKHRKKKSFNIRQSKDKDMLIRKVLSIGRKIMTKNGVSSFGLLTYLEHDNLAIEWSPSKQTTWKESDYVRIITKLRSKIEDLMIGFVCVPFKKMETKYNSNIFYKSNEKTRKSESIALVTTNDDETDIATSQATIVLEPSLVITLSPTQPELVNNPQLLNSNPVPNPKQAPKKKSSNDTKNNQNVEHAKLYTKSIHQVVTDNHMICVDDSDEEINKCLPVITCTTSLASTSTSDTKQGDNKQGDNKQGDNKQCDNKQGDNKQCDNKQCDNKQGDNRQGVNKQKEKYPEWMNGYLRNTPVARIKCKPVSELMSKAALSSHNNYISQHQEVIAESTGVSPQADVGYMLPNTLACLPPPIIPIVTTASPPVEYLPLPLPTMPVMQFAPLPPHSMQVLKTIPENHLVLHTYEMPNTLTKSPFQYLKNLLHMKGLTLLDSITELPPLFISLIAFKLKISTPKSSTLNLCLALKAFNQKFCIKVWSDNESNIDLDKFPSMWQWEVIKAFHDETVKVKILSNHAQHPSLIQKSEVFLNILKSVQLKIFK